MGWFSYRPGTPLHASMRESAVTRHLASLLPGGALFAALSQSAPDSATLGMQHMLYYMEPQTGGSSGNGVAGAGSGSGAFGGGNGPEQPSLRPLPLQVLNLGRGLGSNAYGGLGSSATVSNSHGSVNGSGLQLPAAALPPYTRRLRELAESTAAEAARGMELAYGEMVEELQGSWRAAPAAAAAGAAATEQRHAALLRKLGGN